MMEMMEMMMMMKEWQRMMTTDDGDDDGGGSEEGEGGGGVPRKPRTPHSGCGEKHIRLLERHNRPSTRRADKIHRQLAIKTY